MANSMKEEGLHPLKSTTMATSGDTLPPLLTRVMSKSDLPRIKEHYFELSPSDRINRFGGSISDEVLASYVQRIDFHRKIVLGVVALESGRVVALAEADFNSSRPETTAEVAVSVSPSWQDQGLGSALVSEATAHCFALGAPAVEFYFSVGNRAMKSIVKKLGGEVSMRGDHAIVRRFVAQAA